MASERQRFCIIVGAGVSGMIQAAELLKKGVLKPEQLEILDRGKDYGGVWSAANYPGAGCDVFSILYEISSFRNPGWQRLFPGRDELVDYYNAFAERYDLRSLTSFNTNVIEAAWSEENMMWTVTTENTISKQRTVWTANILLYAPGTYNRSVVPNVPGISTFQGDIWHTNDWPSDVDLSGKVVAYVGCGPSAVQILRSIQPSVKSLKVYVRTMTFCLPMGNPRNSRAIQFLKKWVPGLLSIYAFLLGYIFGLWTYCLFRPGSVIAKTAEWYCVRFLEKEVKDPVLREKLRPVGRLGAKRPLVSRDLYKLLQASNVEVISDPITRIDGSGVFCTVKEEISKKGQEMTCSSGIDSEESQESHNKVDVIIWGTGFKMQGWGTAFEILGRRGQSLGQHWGGKPKTLYGLATSDFPNLLLLSGPNTAAPWASLVSGIELQAQYNVRVIREIKKRCINGCRFAVMPEPDAEASYTASLQPELEKLATSAAFGPKFYYVTDDGTNTFFFPFTQLYYRWLLRKFDWNNYTTLERHFPQESIVLD